jgi:HEAT repeat protein
VLGPRSAAASDDVVARICNPRWISAEAYYRRGRESRVFERLGPPAVSAVDRALKQALANRAVPKAYQEQVKRIGRAAMHIVFPALEYARDRRNTARRAPDVADDPQPARVRAATVRILEWASEQSLKLAVETEQIPVHWLGTVGPAARSAVPTLVAALDDAWFRDDAIIALGGIGKDAAPAVAHLLPLLDSDDAALRHLAREALEKIGVFDEAARARLRPWLTSGDLHEREEAARALAACGEHAEQIIPTLIELAIDPHFNPRAQLQPGDWHSPGVYATLLASMASTGPAAVPMLIDALQSPDPNVRRAAAEALVKIGPTAKGAVPSLIELLDDHDSWDAAAEALGRMGREARAAVPKLLAVFEAVQMPGSPEEYVPIVHALGGIGPDARDALPAVLKLADVDDPEIRHAAVMALARIDPTNSSLVPQLRRLLAEWERSSLIQDAWAESAVSMPDVGLEQIADAVWELGPRAAGLVPDLRRMVTTAPLLEPRVRCYAAFALASFARQRQVAQQCLQNFATTDQAGPLMGSARLASELLQRINGAPPAPTAD